jgi:hypothetical protein
MQALLDMIMDSASERTQQTQPHYHPSMADAAALRVQLRQVAGILLGCCIMQHSAAEQLYGSRIEVGEVKGVVREAVRARGHSMGGEVLERLHAWASAKRAAPNQTPALEGL